MLFLPACLLDCISFDVHLIYIPIFKCQIINDIHLYSDLNAWLKSTGLPKHYCFLSIANANLLSYRPLYVFFKRQSNFNCDLINRSSNRLLRYQTDHCLLLIVVLGHRSHDYSLHISIANAVRSPYTLLSSSTCDLNIPIVSVILDKSSP